ncbi:MAG: hypothetical protein KF735_03120 [Chelatococcus sp.]|uniref:hypothetical protein n=1 Tax=Chelatococcus sp. TaxID=1953771 RepID=UPI0025B9F185|nr:hypothetical protein [Chelatococcus sp.]MBX3536606.1 hypothetical protein [Chelatococcus sp.]
MTVLSMRLLSRRWSHCGRSVGERLLRGKSLQIIAKTKNTWRNRAMEQNRTDAILNNGNTDIHPL